MTKSEIEKHWTECREECDQAYAQVKTEPYPDPDDIWNGIFAEGLDDSYPKKGGS